MPKYDRLLYILNLLRSRKTLNAGRLATECNVTERSIYRDLISLSEANIPIYYDRGYKLASDNFLPPLNFTLEEYRYLKLALESSPLNRADKSGGLLKQIRAKIEAGLSEITKQRKTTARDAAFIDIENTSAEENSRLYFADIEQAAGERLCLDLEYDSINSGLTTRRVEPYFIIFRGRAFYFVAYCQLRQDFRTFRLDRVKKLSVTGVRFRRRHDVSAADYFEHSWRVYSGDLVDVHIEFSGKAARVIRTGRYHQREIRTELPGGRVQYEVRVRGIEEIARWIVGFGGEARVVSPKELRELVKATAANIVKMYNNAGRKTEKGNRTSHRKPKKA